MRTYTEQPVAPGSSSDSADELVTSPSMQVERSDARTTTIYLDSTGSRIRIPRRLHRLLLDFEEPRTLMSVAGDDDRLVRALETLRAKGFLVARSDLGQPIPTRLVTDPTTRLLDCPPHETTSATVDVVVIGIPYDHGAPTAAGMRGGPSALRETSLQTLYRMDRRTTRPLGWFDADRGCRILEGVTIADGGDVLVEHGEPQARLFDRAGRILHEVTGSGAMPVVLGGDATASFPVINAMQGRAPLTVIRIGSSSATVAKFKSPYVTEAALPASVLELPAVDCCLLVGAQDGIRDGPDGFHAITTPVWRSDGEGALERFLADRRKVHVGVDVSGLARAADAVDARLGRLTHAEAQDVLMSIGRRHEIVSMDIVGLNPANPGWRSDAMSALHLLLSALSAAKDAHSPGAVS